MPMLFGISWLPRLSKIKRYISCWYEVWAVSDVSFPSTLDYRMKSLPCSHKLKPTGTPWPSLCRLSGSSLCPSRWIRLAQGSGHHLSVGDRVGLGPWNPQIQPQYSRTTSLVRYRPGKETSGVSPGQTTYPRQIFGSRENPAAVEGVAGQHGSLPFGSRSGTKDGNLPNWIPYSDSVLILSRFDFDLAGVASSSYATTGTKGE
ncbi:hypothetical protein VTK56DRAFT_8602 [Thermocarpiscus australiensis]